ncbi:OsmC family protein [Luteitalea sp.]|uniref:OsmC family protein n=1 Tax=Luteitalea sp. TaxID=2004800 RepID=UPI000A8EF717|nr:OsmC family protein [Luteitalea sp.]
MSSRTLDATATLGNGYQTSVTTRTHAFAADEPVTVGGTDTAPTPMELLSGSLAACTAITLRMYAGRKGWSLDGLTVRVEYTAQPTPAFVKHLTMTGALDDTQKARLLEIAEACPVAKLLKAGAASETRLA